MIAGQTYWKNAYMPAGVCTVITPMNFIYGIPGIQIVGLLPERLADDLQGAPLLRHHEHHARARCCIAAGADPRAVHKLEGFGGDIAPLAADPRVAVVSVTGSAETAKIDPGQRAACAR